MVNITMALTGTAVSRAITPSPPGRLAPGIRAGVSALSIRCGRLRAWADSPPMPWVERIVRWRGRQLGGEQPRIRVSVRPYCGRAVAYSEVVTRWRLRRARAATMRLELKPFDFAQAVARAGLKADGTPLARPAAAPAGSSFQQAMTQALSGVSAQQRQAEALQRELQLDNPAVSLEQTMVAMQKAQIGFQGVLAVRNRLVQAYSEIMNMQV